VENLYNSLTSPAIEYNDKGEMLHRAPTSVMLRAARALKEINNINTANQLVINQLTNQINELNEQLKLKDKEIEQFKAEQKSLYGQLLDKDANESLREARQQVSNVGSSGIPDQRNDTTSEAGIQPEGGGPGSS